MENSPQPLTLHPQPSPLYLLLATLRSKHSERNRPSWETQQDDFSNLYDDQITRCVPANCYKWSVNNTPINGHL